MKGFAVTIGVMAVFALMMIGLAIFIEQNILENLLEESRSITMTTYTMDNALKATQLYANTALDYSTYQSCYTLLRNGGYLQIPQDQIYSEHALWYNKKDLSPQHDVFLSELRSSVENSFSAYTTTPYHFLNFKVALPSYIIQIDPSSTDSTLVIASEENTPFTLTDTDHDINQSITVRRTSDLKKSLDIECIGLFSEGKKLFAGFFNTFLFSLSETIEPLPTQLTMHLNDSHTLDQTDSNFPAKAADLLFTESRKLSKEEFETEIEQAIREQFVFFASHSAEYEISRRLQDIDITILPQCTIARSQNPPQRSLTCDFVYSASYTYVTSITNEKESYPVSTGLNVSEEYLSLRYAISNTVDNIRSLSSESHLSSLGAQDSSSQIPEETKQEFFSDLKTSLPGHGLSGDKILLNAEGSSPKEIIFLIDDSGSMNSVLEPTKDLILQLAQTVEQFNIRLVFSLEWLDSNGVEEKWGEKLAVLDVSHSWNPEIEDRYVVAIGDGDNTGDSTSAFKEAYALFTNDIRVYGFDMQGGKEDVFCSTFDTELYTLQCLSLCGGGWYYTTENSVTDTANGIINSKQQFTTQETTSRCGADSLS